MTNALSKLSTQQDADSMSIRIFLSSPWHTRACWRLEEKQHKVERQSPFHQLLVPPLLMCMPQERCSGYTFLCHSNKHEGFEMASSSPNGMVSLFY